MPAENPSSTLPPQHQEQQPGRESLMQPAPATLASPCMTGQVLHPNGGRVLNG